MDNKSLWLTRTERFAAYVSGATAILLTLLHLIQPEVDPLHGYINKYALGQLGILMNLTFALLAASVACLGFSAWTRIANVAARIGAVLA